MIGSSLLPLDVISVQAQWKRNITKQERMVHAGLEQSLAKQRVASKSRFGTNPQIDPGVAGTIVGRVEEGARDSQNISRLTRTNLYQVKKLAS